MVFNTNTSAESGSATLAQVWKVVLQHDHKWGKRFSTLTGAQKVDFNTNRSAKRGFASLAQVCKVVFNTITSVESGSAPLIQVWKVVTQQQHKCEKWFCIASKSVESGFATITQV